MTNSSRTALAQSKPMGYLHSRLFNVPHYFFSDNHDLSITDLIDIYGAQEISIDYTGLAQDPVMNSLDLSDPDLSTNQKVLLSSSSATVFLHFVPNGPGVEAGVIAAKEALANAGVRRVELLETLRKECRDTKYVKSVP
jgi:hypothetical protein